jgi:hypothetical protein
MKHGELTLRRSPKYPALRMKHGELTPRRSLMCREL